MKETTVELVLEKLNCAVCAAKINDKVSKLENVKEATLNFASMIMTIEISSIDAKIRLLTAQGKL